MANAFNLTAQINLRGPTNLKPIVADIRRQLGSISANVNLNLDAKSAKGIEAVTNRLTAMNTILAQARSNADGLSNTLQGLSNSLSSVQQTSSKASSSISGVSASASASSKDLKKASGAMAEFGKQSALAVKRFAAFSFVTTGVFALINAVNSATKAFIDFDQQTITLQQVTGKGAIGIRALTTEITRLATTYGVSSAALIEAATTLAQAGLSASQTQTALEALAKTELAPSFDDITQTTEGAIAAMRQFGLQAKDLDAALGSINAVSAAFAVEASDIIAAIQRTGGVFASASHGVSEGTDALNEFIAVFTSVRATTRESAETIATGLRTIFTRIQRASTIEALKEFGIELQDLDGKFVGPYEAVKRLSEGLKMLDTRDIRFSGIVEELGGFRQIGKVIPLIQQFATAQDALKIAQSGQASTAKDAVIAQQSLANQIAKVREQFLALVRDVGQSSTFQGFFTIVTKLAGGLISLASAFKPILPLLAIMGAIKGFNAITQFAGGFASSFSKGGGAQAAGQNMGSSVTGSKDKEKADATAKAADAIISNTNALTALTNTISALDANINSLSSAINTNTNTIKVSSTGGAGGATLNKGGVVRKFATGGVVPGSGDRDTVPAMLTPGEFVIRKKAVKSIGKDKLHKMNRYAAGGTVGGGVANVDFEEGYDGDSFLVNFTPANKPYKARTRLEGADAYEIKGAATKAKYNDTEIEKGKQAAEETTKWARSASKSDELLKAFQASNKYDTFGRPMFKSNRLISTLKDKGLLTGRFEEKNLGGMIQKFAEGGVAQRRVGYIDYDVIANEANKAIVEKGMEETGQKGPRLYTDYLTDLVVKARKESSIQKLRAIYGVAGSGKTTLARGQGTDNSRLRKTERFPILTPEDIQKATEVLVLSSSVSKNKLDDMFSATDRTYTLSSTTQAEKEKVKGQRITRDITGVGLEGRQPGVTSSVGTDTAVGEALLGDRLGKRSVVLSRSEEGRLRRKSGNELVEVVKKKIGFTWGGFAPMTAGHESIMDAASAMGISPEDFIYLVGANEGVDAKSYRTAIFDQDARVLLAKAGAGAKGAMVLPKPRDFEVPQGFDISEGDKRRVLIPSKGSTTFVADKGPEETKKYKEAGYGVKNIERTGGISGTMVRDLIASGDLGKLQSVLSPGVYELISNNIGRIQNRANILPSIIAEVQQTQGVKLEGVDKQIKALGISRIDSKKVASDPEYAAQVEVLKELRAKRDKIKSAGSFEPYRLLAALAAQEPDKYGLDFSTPAVTDIKPVRTVSQKVQKANFGGLIQRFMAGGIAEASDPMTDAIAATKSRKDILDLLKKRPNGLQDTAKQVGVNAADIFGILGTRDPDAKTKALQEAIRREYVKTYNRRSGAARATTTKLEDKGFTFGAAGVFGSAGEPENIDIISDRLSKSAKVRVVSGVMDKSIADQLDALLTQGTDDLATRGARLIKGSEPTGSVVKDPSTQGSMQGVILEQIIQRLGGPGKVKGQGFDFPNGLQGAAQYFNLPPDIPTDLKRTLEGPSTIKDNIVTYLKNVMRYAKGGKVDYYSLEKNSGFASREFDTLVQFAKTSDFSLDEFQAYLKQRSSYKSQNAQLRMDPASLLRAVTPEPARATKKQLALADQLKDTSNDIGYRSSNLERIAQARTDINNAMRYAAGGVAEEEKKKEKEYGKISLSEDTGMINVGYKQNETRSGYASAYKMRDNLYYVGLSKATSGYGPKLYDVLMEAATEKGAMLTSDRSSVSDDAKGVWEYYFKNRGDVKKTPLKPSDWTVNESLIDPKLYGKESTWPPASDPAWILQTGYSKSPSLINDEEFVQRLAIGGVAQLTPPSLPSPPKKPDPNAQVKAIYQDKEMDAIKKKWPIGTKIASGEWKLPGHKSIGVGQFAGEHKELTDFGGSGWKMRLDPKTDNDNILIADWFGKNKKLFSGYKIATNTDHPVWSAYVSRGTGPEIQKAAQKAQSDLGKFITLNQAYDTTDTMIPGTGISGRFEIRGDERSGTARSKEIVDAINERRKATTKYKKFYLLYKNSPGFSPGFPSSTSGQGGVPGTHYFQWLLQMKKQARAAKNNEQADEYQAAQDEEIKLIESVLKEKTPEYGFGSQQSSGPKTRLAPPPPPPPKKFASGGLVPGAGNRDTVPAMLNAGDFVIRKKAVETIGVSKLAGMSRYASGGDVSSKVPALLTPGEFVFNRSSARKIGYNKLHKLNHADKLQGYNGGGLVGGWQRFAEGEEVQPIGPGTTPQNSRQSAKTGNKENDTTKKLITRIQALIKINTRLEKKFGSSSAGNKANEDLKNLIAQISLDENASPKEGALEAIGIVKALTKAVAPKNRDQAVLLKAMHDAFAEKSGVKLTSNAPSKDKPEDIQAQANTEYQTRVAAKRKEIEQEHSERYKKAPETGPGSKQLIKEQAQVQLGMAKDKIGDEVKAKYAPRYKQAASLARVNDALDQVSPAKNRSKPRQEAVVEDIAREAEATPPVREQTTEERRGSLKDKLQGEAQEAGVDLLTYLKAQRAALVETSSATATATAPSSTSVSGTKISAEIGAQINQEFDYASESLGSFMDTIASGKSTFEDVISSLDVLANGADDEVAADAKSLQDRLKADRDYIAGVRSGPSAAPYKPGEARPVDAEEQRSKLYENAKEQYAAENKPATPPPSEDIVKEIHDAFNKLKGEGRTDEDAKRRAVQSVAQRRAESEGRTNANEEDKKKVVEDYKAGLAARKAGGSSTATPPSGGGSTAPAVVGGSTPPGGGSPTFKPVAYDPTNPAHVADMEAASAGSTPSGGGGATPPGGGGSTPPGGGGGPPDTSDLDALIAAEEERIKAERLAADNAEYFAYKAKEAGMTTDSFRKKLAADAVTKGKAIQSNQQNLKTGLKVSAIGKASDLKGSTNTKDLEAAQKQFAEQLKAIDPSKTQAQVDEAAKAIVQGLKDGLDFTSITESSSMLSDILSKTYTEAEAAAAGLAAVAEEAGLTIEQTGLADKDGNPAGDDIRRAKFVQSDAGKAFGPLADKMPDLLEKFSKTKTGERTIGAANAFAGVGLTDKLTNKFGAAGKFIGGKIDALGGPIGTLGAGMSILGEQLPAIMGEKYKDSTTVAAIGGGIGGTGKGLASGAALGMQVAGPVGAMIAGITGAVIGGITGAFEAFNAKKLENNIRAVEDSASDLEDALKKLAENANDTNISMAQAATTKMAQSMGGLREQANFGRGGASRSAVEFLRTYDPTGISNAVTGGNVEKEARDTFVAQLGNLYKGAEGLGQQNLNKVSSDQMRDVLTRTDERTKAAVATGDKDKMEEAQKINNKELALANQTVQNLIRPQAMGGQGMDLEQVLIGKAMQQRKSENKDFDGDLKTAEGRAKLREEGEKLFASESEGALRTKLLSRAMRDISIQTENLLETYRRAGAYITRFGDELEAFDNKLMNSVNALRGQAAVGPVDRSNEKVLGNLSGYSQEEVKGVADRVGELAGGGAAGAKLSEQVQTAKVLQDELPKILKGATDENIDSEGGVISQVKEALKGAGLSAPKELLDELSKNLNEKTAGREGGGTSLSDLADGTNVLGSVLKGSEGSLKLAQALQKQYNDALQMTIGYTNEYAKALQEATDYQLQAQDIRLKGELQLKEALGQRMSLDEMNAPGDARIKGLTSSVVQGGTTDPGKILASMMSQTESKKANEEELAKRAMKAAETGEEPDKKAYLEQAKLVADQNNSINNSRKALEELAKDGSGAANALRGLAEQQKVAQGSVNFLQKLMTSDAGQLQEMNKGLAAYTKAVSGRASGSEMNNLQFRQQAFSGLESISSMMPDSVKNQMQATLVENMAASSPELSALLDQKTGALYTDPNTGKQKEMTFRQSLNIAKTGKDPVQEQYINAYKAATERQAQAADALGVAAEAVANKFQEGMLNVLEEIKKNLSSALPKAVEDTKVPEPPKTPDDINKDARLVFDTTELKELFDKFGEKKIPLLWPKGADESINQLTYAIIALTTAVGLLTVATLAAGKMGFLKNIPGVNRIPGLGGGARGGRVDANGVSRDASGRRTRGFGKGGKPKGTPASGTPAAGTPAAGAPASGAPAAGTPASGTPAGKPAAKPAGKPSGRPGGSRPTGRPGSRRGSARGGSVIGRVVVGGLQIGLPAIAGYAAGAYASQPQVPSTQPPTTPEESGQEKNIPEDAFNISEAVINVQMATINIGNIAEGATPEEVFGASTPQQPALPKVKPATTSAATEEDSSEAPLEVVPQQPSATQMAMDMGAVVALPMVAAAGVDQALKRGLVQEGAGAATKTATGATKTVAETAAKAAAATATKGPVTGILSKLTALVPKKGLGPKGSIAAMIGLSALDYGVDEFGGGAENVFGQNGAQAYGTGRNLAGAALSFNPVMNAINLAMDAIKTPFKLLTDTKGTTEGYDLAAEQTLYDMDVKSKMLGGGTLGNVGAYAWQSVDEAATAFQAPVEGVTKLLRSAGQATAQGYNSYVTGSKNNRTLEDSKQTNTYGLNFSELARAKDEASLKVRLSEAQKTGDTKEATRLEQEIKSGQAISIKARTGGNYLPNFMTGAGKDSDAYKAAVADLAQQEQFRANIIGAKPAVGPQENLPETQASVPTGKVSPIASSSQPGIVDDAQKTFDENLQNFRNKILEQAKTEKTEKQVGEETKAITSSTPENSTEASAGEGISFNDVAQGMLSGILPLPEMNSPDILQASVEGIPNLQDLLPDFSMINDEGLSLLGDMNISLDRILVALEKTTVGVQSVSSMPGAGLIQELSPEAMSLIENMDLSTDTKNTLSRLLTNISANIPGAGEDISQKQTTNRAQASGLSRFLKNDPTAATVASSPQQAAQTQQQTQQVTKPQTGVTGSSTPDATLAQERKSYEDEKKAQEDKQYNSFTARNQANKDAFDADVDYNNAQHYTEEEQDRGLDFGHIQKKGETPEQAKAERDRLQKQRDTRIAEARKKKEDADKKAAEAQIAHDNTTQSTEQWKKENQGRGDSLAQRGEAENKRIQLEKDRELVSTGKLSKSDKLFGESAAMYGQPGDPEYMKASNEDKALQGKVARGETLTSEEQTKHDTYRNKQQKYYDDRMTSARANVAANQGVSAPSAPSSPAEAQAAAGSVITPTSSSATAVAPAPTPADLKAKQKASLKALQAARAKLSGLGKDGASFTDEDSAALEADVVSKDQEYKSATKAYGESQLSPANKASRERNKLRANKEAAKKKLFAAQESQTNNMASSLSGSPGNGMTDFGLVDTAKVASAQKEYQSSVDALKSAPEKTLNPVQQAYQSQQQSRRQAYLSRFRPEVRERMMTKGEKAERDLAQARATQEAEKPPETPGTNGPSSISQQGSTQLASVGGPIPTSVPASQISQQQAAAAPASQGGGQNQGGPSPSYSITLDEASKQFLSEFSNSLNNFGSYIDQLSKIHIPDKIEMSHKGVVEVRVSGAAAFSALEEKMQTAINDAVSQKMEKIWNQSGGQLGDSPSMPVSKAAGQV